MTELLNGEQASQLFIQGKAIQHQNICDVWLDVDDSIKISYFKMRKNDLVFREKPPFIIVNGIEVPAPVLQLRSGATYFVLNGFKKAGYERVLCENSTFVATIGCWEYESDIIKVVSAFGKSFHSLMGRKEQN